MVTPNFVKLGEFIRKLKGENYTDSIKIMMPTFFLKKGTYAKNS